MPGGDWIEIGVGVCLSCWHLLFKEPIVMTLFLEIYIWEQEYDSVIHIFHHLLKRVWIGNTLLDLNNQKTYYGLLQTRRISYFAIQEFCCTKWMGKDTHLENQLLKRVIERTLRWQLFLDELQKEFPRWKVIWHLEWRLFLLEWLFHKVATMRKREMQQYLQRCLHSHQSMTAEETAPVNPFVRSLLGSTNDEVLEVAEEVTMDDMCCAKCTPLPVPGSVHDKTSWGAWAAAPDKSWPPWCYKSSQVPIQGQKVLSHLLFIPGLVTLLNHLQVQRHLSLSAAWM